MRSGFGFGINKRPRDGFIWEFTQGVGSGVSGIGRANSIDLTVSANGLNSGWMYETRTNLPLYNWVVIECDYFSDVASPNGLLRFGWTNVGTNLGAAVDLPITSTPSHVKYWFLTDDLLSSPNARKAAFGSIFFDDAGVVFSIRNIQISSSLTLPIEAIGTYLQEDYLTGLHTELGNPSVSSVHANHSISWDSVGQRLKVTATGAGTTYFTWPFSRDSKPYTSFIQVSGMTATGSVSLCRELGAVQDSFTISADGIITSISAVAGTLVTTAIGLSITTAGAGDIYIDRWGFALVDGDDFPIT